MWPELQDSKLCPSTRFPSRPTILERGQGFVVLYPGLIGTWVKPRIGGGGHQCLWSSEALVGSDTAEGHSWVWDRPFVPKSFSAIYVADAVREGGLGLACSELQLATSPRGQRRPSKRSLCCPWPAAALLVSV